MLVNLAIPSAQRMSMFTEQRLPVEHIVYVLNCQRAIRNDSLALSSYHQLWREVSVLVTYDIELDSPRNRGPLLTDEWRDRCFDAGSPKSQENHCDDQSYNLDGGRLYLWK